MIESQYAYFPFIWIFCLKIDMQRVEKVQYIQNFTSGYSNYMAT